MSIGGLERQDEDVGRWEW